MPDGSSLDRDKILGDWLNWRAGKLTASRMKDAADFLKDGKTPSAKRRAYMIELLAEREIGDSVRHFVSDAMQWGIDTEPEAKSAYEAETGTLIYQDPAGRPLAFDHPEIENFAATPDGLLDSHGLIEIKCPTTATFIEWRLAGAVPPEHKPQMLAQMACTRRQWCEFVAYDPRVKNPRQRLFIRRYEPKPEEIERVEAAAIAFLAELEQAWEALHS